MAKIKVSILKANGVGTTVEVENGDAKSLADVLKGLGIKAGDLTRNGQDFSEDDEVEDEDVIVETKSAKGA